MVFKSVPQRCDKKTGNGFWHQNKGLHQQSSRKPPDKVDEAGFDMFYAVKHTWKVTSAQAVMCTERNAICRGNLQYNTTSGRFAHSQKPTQVQKPSKFRTQFRGLITHWNTDTCKESFSFSVTIYSSPPASLPLTSTTFPLFIIIWITAINFVPSN